MHYSDFIQQVSKETRLSQQEAERMTEIVLATLGERISAKERMDVASQLPKEMKSFLFLHLPPHNFHEGVDRFPAEDFYHRVDARGHLGFAAAKKISKAVLQVLKMAVSSGEIQDLLEELPQRNKELFKKG
jgi:uncharacterized protein (DUF2267 family)